MNDPTRAVNPALTPNRPAAPTPKRRPPASPRRRKTPVENTDYAAFAARVIRAHARRIADGDIDALPDLAHLADDLDTALHTAVTALRTHGGYSWTDIATRLGTTRQAAQQRWGTR